METNRIKQHTVVGQVMNEIRDLIASSDYAAGDRIPTEKELAEQFGVGRSSIREAIKIFNYLGVLESRAALGTFIRDRSHISDEAFSWSLLLGNDELDDLIDLRASVELWCVIRLVEGRKKSLRAATDTVSALSAIVDSMEKAVESGDRVPLVEADFQFHHAIITSSENPLFLSIYDTLRSFLRAEIKRSQDDYTDPHQIFREHREILDSIDSGDRERAVTVFAGHIENIKRRLGR